MASSGMLRRVALARTDVSEELSASFIRVGRIGELGTTLAVTSNRRTLLATHTHKNVDCIQRTARHFVHRVTFSVHHGILTINNITVPAHPICMTWPPATSLFLPLKIAPFCLNSGERRRMAGDAERPHRTQLPGVITIKLLDFVHRQNPLE
jgi:hypothetical protein